MSRRKARWVVLWGLAWWLAPSALAQAPADNTPQPTVRVTTGLVLVDAVVTDHEGRPVRDLKAEDFLVYENGKPVKLAFARLHSAGEEGPIAAPASLPPGVYSNRPKYRSVADPLTLLLLDARNTKFQDQAFARLQVLKYLDTQLKPGTRVAVYALGGSLRLLQDFTDDRGQLRAAVEAFRPEPPRELAMEDTTWMLPPTSQTARFSQRLGRLHVQQAVAARDIRVSGTLSAMRIIGRSMAGLPGRKNLMWISSAFPIRVLETQSSYVSEMMVTTALLTDARVAVYPVDARGVVGFGVDASSAGPGLGFATELERISRQLLDTQESMQVLADFTGGRVFKNRNDLDQAVATGIEEGSTYYVLGYYAENKHWDGKFRELKVELKQTRLSVRHRKGYFAFDPERWETRSKAIREDMERMLVAGGIPATMVAFDARITPSGSGTRVKLPIQFRVDARTLTGEASAGGKRYAVEFHAVAVDSRGIVAARLDQELKALVRSAQLQALEDQGLPFRMELEVPAGRYEIRLGVRDIATGSFGTLSAPVEAAVRTQ